MPLDMMAPRHIYPLVGYEALPTPRRVRQDRTGRPAILVGYWLSPTGQRIGADVLERSTWLGPVTILDDPAP